MTYNSTRAEQKQQQKDTILHHNEVIVESLKKIKIENVNNANDLFLSSDNHGTAISLFGEGIKSGVFQVDNSKLKIDKKMVSVSKNTRNKKEIEYIEGITINPNFQGTHINLGDLVDRGVDSALILNTLEHIFAEWKIKNHNIGVENCPYKIVLGNHDVPYEFTSTSAYHSNIITNFIGEGFASFALPINFNGEYVCASHTAFSKKEETALGEVLKNFHKENKLGNKKTAISYTLMEQELENMFGKDNIPETITGVTDEKKILLRNAVANVTYKKYKCDAIGVKQDAILKPMVCSAENRGTEDVFMTTWNDVSFDGKKIAVPSVFGHERVGDDISKSQLKDSAKKIVGYANDFSRFPCEKNPVALVAVSKLDRSKNFSNAVEKVVIQAENVAVAINGGVVLSKDNKINNFMTRKQQIQNHVAPKNIENKRAEHSKYSNNKSILSIKTTPSLGCKF